MSNITITGALTVEPIAAQAIIFKKVARGPKPAAGAQIEVASAVTDASGAWSVSLPPNTGADFYVARLASSLVETPFYLSPASSSPVAIADCVIVDPFAPRAVVQAAVSSSDGGGTADALPIADPTGVTTETAANSIKGSGTYNVVTFPADSVAVAWKLEGDAFPRLVMPVDPNDYGALFMGDGTTDPLGSSGAGLWFTGRLIRSRGFSAGAITIDGITDILKIDDSEGGVVQSAPDGSLHRIKVANDGTLSTEVVT
jgi:hypothetical protein